MSLNLLAWIFSGLLALYCLFLAYSAWRQEAGLSGRGRMSLLVALLEAAVMAALLRLVVQWSPGTVLLWVVALAALAAASAGIIIRWHVLPVRSRFRGSPARNSDSEPGEGADVEPVEPWESAEVPAGTGATSTATALRKQAQEASPKKPRKPKKPKKPKKEPGWPAVIGHACCLGAVVVFSFFVG